MTGKLTLASLLLAASFITPVFADPGAIKSTLDPLYQRYVDACQTKDVKTALSLMTPDFSFKQETGQTMTRQQLGKTREQEWSHLTGIHATCRIVSISEDGTGALALVNNHLEARYADRTGSHKLQSDSMTRDAWVQVDHAWKIRSTEVIRGSASLDGKNLPDPRF